MIAFIHRHIALCRDDVRIMLEGSESVMPRAPQVTAMHRICAASCY